MKKIFTGIIGIILLISLSCSISVLAETSANDQTGSEYAVSSQADSNIVKGDEKYGINGLSIPYSTDKELSAGETLDVAVATSSADYTEIVSFGVRFTKTADGYSAQSFYNDGNAITLCGTSVAVSPSVGENVLLFKVKNQFNPDALAGLWEIRFNGEEVGLDVSPIEQTQASFTDGYGWVNAAYNGNSNVNVALGSITCSQDAMHDLTTDFGSAGQQWTVSFAAGLNTPVKAGYGRSGYLTIKPNYSSGQYTIYKSDCTYSLDGLEIVFDYYSPEGSASDFRILYSDASVFKMGFFIRKGSASGRAKITFYGASTEVGSIDIPFNFDGTNSIKLSKSTSTGKWGVTINGNRYMEDCHSIIESDVANKFTNQQANVYLWDADSEMENYISLRAIRGGAFKGEPEGWKRGDEDTNFVLSAAGNVKVTSEGGDFKAIRDDDVFDVTRFTHDFAIHKEGENTQGVSLVLSSDSEWYENGHSAVLLTFQYARTLGTYIIYNVDIGVYRNGTYAKLAGAETSKFYPNAMNHMAFGKTLSGWVLRLNGEELSFDGAIDDGLNGVRSDFTDDAAYLQIHAKTAEAGTSYEYKSAFAVLAQMSYPTNWAPGKAGGSDFGEPTKVGEQILIPAASVSTYTYSGIKIDRKVPVDGFSFEFDLMRTTGDDGKHFGVIIANTSSWYQDCKSVMLMFRPQGFESGVYDQAEFSLAYSDFDNGLDLEGDIIKGGMSVTVPFNWQGRNLLRVYSEDDRWYIEINGESVSSVVSATSKIEKVIDSFDNGQGYLQLWNGEAYTVCTIVDLSVSELVKTLPIITGSFNFDTAKVGEEISVDLTQLFTERDGDPLKYSASAGTIEGNIWTYKVEKEGLQFVTVTATNFSYPELSADYLVRINTDGVAPNGGTVTKKGCGSSIDTVTLFGGLFICGITLSILYRKKNTDGRRSEK